MSFTNVSFLILISFKDPGPHGNGRYSEHMLPEVEVKDFRKGAQVYILAKVMLELGIQHFKQKLCLLLYKECEIWTKYLGYFILQ